MFVLKKLEWNETLKPSPQIAVDLFVLTCILDLYMMLLRVQYFGGSTCWSTYYIYIQHTCKNMECFVLCLDMIGYQLND